MGFFIRDERVDYLMEQVALLTTRVQVLETNARYVADQPQYQSFFSLSQYNSDWNVVPLNSVVKAIVKHLDMQIENVPAHTINSPQEIKVVPKPVPITGATIVGTDGNTGTTWVSPGQPPTPKPKRKYTKRKTK